MLCPLPESAVVALKVDLDRRCDVSERGKRPRDAFNAMPNNVAKRFNEV